MDDENLLSVALASVLRRYMKLRTLAANLAPEDHELHIGPDEIEEVTGLIVVVRCDEVGGLAISLVLPPPEEGDSDGDSEVQDEEDSGAEGAP